MEQLNNNKLGIRCEWLETQRLLVNPDGQVFPCCYLGNVMYTSDLLGRPTSWTPKEKYGIEDQIGDIERVAYITNTEQVLKEYDDNRDGHNLFKTPLEDIIESEWFTKTLPESWDDPKRAIRQCVKYCTKKNDK